MENQFVPTANQGGGKKGIWIVLLIVIIVGALAVGGSFAYKKWWGKSEQKSAENITQADPFDRGFDKEAATSDPFHDPNGPFYHTVKLATSTDGIIFTDTGKTILDKASVPDAIKLSDGTILIYAVDGSNRSNSSMLVAQSKDNGTTWKVASLQLKTNRSDATGVDPDVVWDNGKLRLFYIIFGFTSSQQKPAQGEKTVNKIYTATSTDGINFSEEDEPVFDDENITDPDVIKIGDKWFAYISQGPKNILALLGDDFKFQYNKVIREMGSISNTVEIVAGEYRQFFCKNGISSAISSDGYSWSGEVVSLAAPTGGKIICDPAPIKVGSQWLLYYKEGPQPTQNSQNPSE